MGATARAPRDRCLGHDQGRDVAAASPAGDGPPRRRVRVPSGVLLRNYIINQVIEV